jgi:hypothetical protein
MAIDNATSDNIAIRINDRFLISLVQFGWHRDPKDKLYANYQVEIAVLDKKYGRLLQDRDGYIDTKYIVNSKELISEIQKLTSKYINIL